MKKRIDVLLVEQGFFESREKAKRSIMAGLVFVNNQKCDKAGTEVNTDAKIEVKGNPIPYVSRGGLKLEKAIVFKADIDFAKEFFSLSDLFSASVFKIYSKFKFCSYDNKPSS